MCRSSSAGKQRTLCARPSPPRLPLLRARHTVRGHLVFSMRNTRRVGKSARGRARAAAVRCSRGVAPRVGPGHPRHGGPGGAQVHAGRVHARPRWLRRRLQRDEQARPALAALISRPWAGCPGFRPVVSLVWEDGGLETRALLRVPSPRPRDELGVLPCRRTALLFFAFYGLGVLALLRINATRLRGTPCGPTLRPLALVHLRLGLAGMALRRGGGRGEVRQGGRVSPRPSAARSGRLAQGLLRGGGRVLGEDQRGAPARPEPVPRSNWLPERAPRCSKG